MERYKQAIGRPGCLHAGLNYYRAVIDGVTWAAPMFIWCATSVEPCSPEPASPTLRTSRVCQFRLPYAANASGRVSKQSPFPAASGNC